ncbi:MAG TPA: DUF885 domain-containing protein [Mycobacteriales bacterium]|nr:DUF885 domain-containing protein [Mycobacteriales bacterium]
MSDFRTAASAELAELVDRAWTAALDADPLNATALGERRYDAVLADNSPAGLAATDRELRELRRRAEALPDPGLTGADRVNRSALVAFLDAELAAQIPLYADWSVDPMLGPQVILLTIGAYQPLDEPGQGATALTRWRRMAPYVDQHAANVRSALADGRAPAAVLVRKVIAQLDDLLGRPVAESALLVPAGQPRPAWTDAERDRFDAELAGVVSDEVLPAFARLRTLLAEEILPAARPDDRAGVGHLPGGAALYHQALLGFGTAGLTAEQVHQTGLREIARNDAELVELGGRTLGTAGLAATLDRLRTARDLAFGSRQEILDAARRAVDRAEAALPDWFRLRHDRPCEVLPAPPHEEADSPPGYYRSASGDGSRPGQFLVNTLDPDSRPRFVLEATAYHEAVPGHHLQFEVGQRLTGLPAFRRHSVAPAYAEGWGLYAELLADEMGLYSGDLDRLGARSMDALRSCRLVVDSGLHALGWSRRQAIDFVLAHTTLAERAAASEVDRYLAWPGQALSYKLGQREILALRAEARARQGDRFDVRDFHDVVLAQGGLPLVTLREVVTAALP